MFMLLRYDKMCKLCAERVKIDLDTNCIYSKYNKNVRSTQNCRKQF